MRSRARIIPECGPFCRPYLARGCSRLIALGILRFGLNADVVDFGDDVDHDVLLS